MICDNFIQKVRNNQIEELGSYLVKRIIKIKKSYSANDLTKDPRIISLIRYIDVLLDIKLELRII